MACFLQVHECTLSLSMQPHLRLVIEKEFASRTNKVVLYLCVVLFMFEYTLSLSRTNKVMLYLYS